MNCAMHAAYLEFRAKGRLSFWSCEDLSHTARPKNEAIPFATRPAKRPSAGGKVSMPHLLLGGL